VTVRQYKYDIFISHNRADKEWAKELASKIASEKYNGRLLRPWLDEQKVEGTSKEIALEYLQKIANVEFNFIDEIQKIEDNIKFAQESTLRQFNHYITWWPEVYISSAVIKLKVRAIELIEKSKI
jgi:hypothetical protein